MERIRPFYSFAKQPARAAFLAVALAALGAVGATPPVLAQETYRAATTGVNPGGGIGVEVLDAVAADVGFNVQFMTMINAELGPALLGGTIDIIAQPTIATPERIAQGMAFSIPYALGAEGLVVKAEDATEYRALADLVGQIVGAVRGTSYQTLLENSGVAFAAIQLFDTQADMVAAITAGSIKAGVSSATSVGYGIQQGQMPGLKLASTWVPTLTTPFSIVVEPADATLLGRIDVSLAKLIADGTIAEIYAGYGITWVRP